MDNNNKIAYAMLNRSNIREFILDRLYMAHIPTLREITWVYDKDNEKMIKRKITYIPGLYKIFDEILLNVAHNKQRDENLNTIKIDIDVDKNTISVWNNGKGIPVFIFEGKNIYIPTIIYENLSTSSDYNCIKLCDIFSTSFTVETASITYKKLFKQSWNDNMNESREVSIEQYNNDDGFTHVEFSPNLNKLNIKKLDDDIVDLMSRRAYDLAATLNGVEVILNGSPLPIKNFKEYCELYTHGECDDSGMPLKIAYESFGPNWQVGLTLSNDGYKQVSFVNSIATTEGGRHVDYVTELIVDVLSDMIEKNEKKYIVTKPKAKIKRSMWIFVNCAIDNPEFDSVEKEKMISEVENLGSKFEISDEFKDLMAGIGIIQSVMLDAKIQADYLSQKQRLSPEPEFERKRVEPSSGDFDFDEEPKWEFQDDEFW